MDLKYQDELNYWKSCFAKGGNRFGNAHYKKLMLALAGEKDDSFMRNKVVADFGCGPRGSLVWTQEPQIKVGIDVLVDQYYTAFGSEMASHGCWYVKSTEYAIPLPDNSVDILYTINSLDHTKDLAVMTSELLRILKDGGQFLASLNVNEKATSCEPQTITLDFIHTAIVEKLENASLRTEKRHPEAGYANFYTDGAERPDPHEPHIAWVRGTKKTGAVRRKDEQSARKTCPSPVPEAIAAGSRPVSIEEAFDADFYLHRNPDVACSTIPPLVHFLRFGHKEKRNPAPWFDLQFYLATYPDVQQLHMNPFLHYLQYGAREGRKPQA